MVGCKVTLFALALRRSHSGSLACPIIIRLVHGAAAQCVSRTSATAPAVRPRIPQQPVGASGTHGGIHVAHSSAATADKPSALLHRCRASIRHSDVLTTLGWTAGFGCKDRSFGCSAFSHAGASVSVLSGCPRTRPGCSTLGCVPHTVEVVAYGSRLPPAVVSSVKLDKRHSDKMSWRGWTSRFSNNIAVQYFSAV